MAVLKKKPNKKPAVLTVSYLIGIKSVHILSIVQMQREWPAETPCLHRTAGEAAELGGQLL